MISLKDSEKKFWITNFKPNIFHKTCQIFLFFKILPAQVDPQAKIIFTLQKK